MSVVDAPRQAWTPEQAIHDVVIDLRLLRDWTSPVACASATSELERVRQSLLDEGIVPSSASRIAAAVAAKGAEKPAGTHPMRTEGPNFVRRKSERRLLQLMLLGRTCTCACAPSACGGLCSSEPNSAKHRLQSPSSPGPVWAGSSCPARR